MSYVHGHRVVGRDRGSVSRDENHVITDNLLFTGDKLRQSISTVLPTKNKVK